MRGRSRCRGIGLRRLGSGLLEVIGLSLKAHPGDVPPETASSTFKILASNVTANSNTRDALCA